MKLIDRIRQHPAVEACYDENEGFFTYLKPGWEWSEQRCFGTETLTEAWRLVKESKKVTDG